MPEVLPAAELQQNFKEVLDRCEQSKEPIYLTRNGHAPVVVIYASTFDREMDLHEKVYDREMRVSASIQRGYDDYIAKRYHTLDEALAYADKCRAAS